MKIPVKQYFQLLVNYLKPQWTAVLLLMVLLLGSIALQLINPQIIRYFIDAAQAGAPVGVLLRAALLFLALALVQQGLSVLARYYSENVAWKTTNALRVDLADHCLRLDLSFHNAHTPGELIERLDGDVSSLSNFFSQFIIQFVGNGILLMGVLVLLFREDWRVGMVISAFAAAALFIIGRFRNIAVPHWTAERQASAELYGFLEERLAGTEDIRSNGAEAYVMRQFYRLMRTLMQRSLKAALMVNILLNAMFFLFAAGTAAAFAIGAYLFQSHVVTIGAVYIIFSYTSMLERPINTISHQIEDLQKAGAGIARVRELMGIQNKIRSSGSRHFQAFSAHKAMAVAFRGVTFGYKDSLSDNGKKAVSASDTPERDDKSAGGASPKPENEIVLDNLSFHLAPGTVLGLLGRTGSGKTTLTRLLFRFYDPDRGAVLVGQPQTGTGKSDELADIREFPLDVLRQRIGMVTQNIQLFNATVRDNLIFFDHSIPDEKLLAVVEELGLREWFRSLPKGLDTMLDSGGSGLSAGEAQLLAFMRIFLKDPGLVILDEASSRLDLATEALIERAVTRLVRDRTAIIIAHRLATVQRADEIMILEGGCVVEHGRRMQLAADPASRFYHLLQTGLDEVLV